MSSLRRRTHDSSWQWLAIGVVLGLGCSGVLCLGMYLLNIVRFGVPGEADLASAPTVVLVVTSTDEPATPTLEPTPTTGSAGEATITPQNPLVKPSDTPVELDQTLVSSTQVPTAATAADVVGTPIDLFIAQTLTATHSGMQVASNATSENSSGGNTTGINDLAD